MNVEDIKSVKIDRVGAEVVVLVNGQEALREPYPVPSGRLRRKDREQWLVLWVWKALGADIEPATPRRLRRLLGLS